MGWYEDLPNLIRLAYRQSGVSIQGFGMEP